MTAICKHHSLELVPAIEKQRAGDASFLNKLAQGFARHTQGVVSCCMGAIDGVQVPRTPLLHRARGPHASLSATRTLRRC